MNKKEALHIRLKRERERRHFSQKDLADQLEADVKTIRRWERGESIPGPFLSRQLEKVFGTNLDEIGKEHDTSLVNIHNTDLRLHDKALPSIPPSQPSTGVVAIIPHVSQSTPSEERVWEVQEELSEAPYRIHFQGRIQEIDSLRSWIVDMHCQVIAILGVGGVGKTALATSIIEHIKLGFVKVFWRSLHNAPPFEHILKHCIQFVSAQEYSELPENIEDQITMLVRYLQQKRCLIILDNVESIMQAGLHVGQYRAGYEGYGRLIQRLAEARHQSCLLLTSREKPLEVALMEGKNSPVRSFYLEGLEQAEGKTILRERELFGQDEDWAELVKLYAGNPLALKLISGPIEEVFNGDISRFLHEAGAVFGGISNLLDQQFRRLSSQEQELLYWLAIEREAVTIDDIYRDVAHPLSRRELVEAFSSLRRRSLVERRGSDTFSLQAVIIEYVTNMLVDQFVGSFQHGENDCWNNYALLKAQTKDYVKASQVLLIIAPIARHLLDMMKGEKIEEVLLHRLAQHRQSNLRSQGYFAGNVLNFLIYLQRDLRGKDFSSLPIRQADLQNALLPEVNFSNAHFSAVSFTNTFGNVQSVTFSSRGDLLAAGTASGEIWLYDALSQKPLYTYRGHMDTVWSVVFNQDDTLLASCSDDRTIRIWESNSGRCLKILYGHEGRVRSLAFHPHGRLLASGSEDQSVRLWDVQTATCLKTFTGHSDRVWSVAFSPDGQVLASGSTDRSVRLWDVQTAMLLNMLQGHTGWIRSVAFSPRGDIIASCGDDMCIILWDAQTGALLKTLRGHVGRVWTIAFDAGGQLLVSGSEDQCIRIWDINTGYCSVIMQGHSNGIRSAAFSPDGRTVVSGGDDQTTRFWDVATGYCLRTLYGHTSRIWSAIFSNDGRTLVSCHEDRMIRLWDLNTHTCHKTLQHHVHGVRAIALAPDSRTLASGGEDQLVRLWDMQSGRCFKTLQGHNNWIRTVAFSLDGSLLASGGEDHAIHLWESISGRCVTTFEGHTSWIRSLAFHPDGNMLASGSDDETIKLWHTVTGHYLRELVGHRGHVRSVCFHPKGQLMASGGEDCTLRLWDVSTGACLNIFSDHQNWVRCVTFSFDGTWLASCSDDCTICLYRVDGGAHYQTLKGHTARVRWISFHPDGQSVASSSDDGSIKLWEIHTGHCLQTLFNERLYERMNITAAQGLTDAQKLVLHALGAVEEDAPDLALSPGQESP